MEYSVTFARLFSRLVGLLVHEAGKIDEQKMDLRAAVAVGKRGAVRLSVRDGQLLADDEPVPGVLSGVADVVERMAGAGLSELVFTVGASAAEILGQARALAADADATTGGAEPPPVADAPVVEPEPAAAPEPAAEPAVPGLISDQADSMFYQFSAVGAVKDSPEALLGRLEAAANPAEAIRLLDDVVLLAETAAREGKSAALVDLMSGVVRCEHAVSNADVKRAYVMALRRMSKPFLLRTVAGLVSGEPERRGKVVAVLVRTGQDGAEALVDQMSNAPTAEDRRVMYEVLSGLEAAVQALIHMLGDARWFVARNAADLLAEMKAGDAESALVGLLHHTDDRVRRSATNALMELGTESARQAVRAAVRDPAPQVRMQAAFAIAAHRDPQTATTLITAIDAETDSDVQLAILLALGRVGTPDAVQRLVRAAEPERGLFKKKTTAFRVAAVQALAEVKSAAAQAALKALASDKEREVRDTVARLSQHGKRG